MHKTQKLLLSLLPNLKLNSQFCKAQDRTTTSHTQSDPSPHAPHAKLLKIFGVRLKISVIYS